MCLAVGERCTTVVPFESFYSSIYLQQCIIMLLMVRESTLLLKMLPKRIKPHVLPLTQRPPLKTRIVPGRGNNEVHWFSLKTNAKLHQRLNWRAVELNSQPTETSSTQRLSWICNSFSLKKKRRNSSEPVSVIFCRWWAVESNRSPWALTQTPPTSCGSIGPWTWVPGSRWLSPMAAQRGSEKVKVDSLMKSMWTFRRLLSGPQVSSSSHRVASRLNRVSVGLLPRGTAVSFIPPRCDAEAYRCLKQIKRYKACLCAS